MEETLSFEKKMDRSEESLEGTPPIATNESGLAQSGIAPQSPALGVSGAQPLFDGQNDDDDDGGGGNGSEAATSEGSDKWRGDGVTAAGKSESNGAVYPPEESPRIASRAHHSPPNPKPHKTPYYSSRPQRMPVRYAYYQVPATHPIYLPPAGYIQPQQPAQQLRSHQTATTPADNLSSTNLYIRGLAQNCSDEDLVKMCGSYGRIVSTKAILDKQTNICKGYGFVDFESPADAQKAVSALVANGVQAQFAKQQEQDPTNLYMSNLPKEYEEKNIEYLLSQYGAVISTRVLRDQSGVSRGVGFARLDSKENCERAIEALNGHVLEGTAEPLVIKFADGGSSRRKGSPHARWNRDIPELIYENPQLFNGIMTPRGLVHQGMVTPYGVTPAPISGYQMPVSTSGSWAGQTAFYLTPGGPGMDSIHALTGQLGSMHLTNSYGSQIPHPYQLPAHAPQFTAPGPAGWTTQTPGGWAMAQAPPLPPPPHMVHPMQGLLGIQDHSEGSGDPKAHHVQVIGSDHLAQVEDKTGGVYYPPTTSWSSK